MASANLAGSPTSLMASAKPDVAILKDLLTGKVIRQCLPRHGHTEFLKFLRGTIHREVPYELAVHLICDNYATQQAPERAGLARQTPPIPTALHPDLIVVAQPGRALVPGTDRQGAAPRRVSLPDPDLIAKIEDYLAAHKNDPANDSYGPPPPKTSSPRSPADASRSKRSTNDETHH